MSAGPCFVGIDVAKAQLDIAVRPSDARWQIPNDPEGYAALVERLSRLAPALIVLEATGGFEAPAVAALAAAEVPGGGVNPRQGRGFCKARGQLAKTDAISAASPGPFAHAVRSPARPPPQS